MPCNKGKGKGKKGKLPKSIKVGGHTVRVVFPYHFKERNDLVGQYDFNGKEIRITDVDSNGVPIRESEIYCTFIHELLHAIDKNSGHRLFNDHENALDGVANGLYQVLVDNGYLKGKK